MSHQEALAGYGANVDTEISGLQDQVTLAEGRVAVLEQVKADLTSQLQSALDAATQSEAELSSERLKNQSLSEDLAVCRRNNRRLRRQLADCEGPQVREPIFSAKPEPNTEAEYARSAARAGVPYPLHRHYATSHDELVAKTNACEGDICAITYEAYESSTRRLLVLVEKLRLLDDRPIWLGYKHEPEDDIESGRFTLAEFLSANNRLNDALEVINADREHPIVLDLCLQGPWTWRTRNPDDYFIPGVHTQVGTDPYPGFINAADPYSVTAEQMFGRQVAWAKERGVDLWAAEWGITPPPATDPGARAAWIRSMTTYGRENELLAMSYWDHGTNILTTDDEFAAAGGA